MSTTDATMLDTDATEESMPEPLHDPAQESPEGRTRGNSEAAKYRKQLREAESARDALAAQTEAVQRRFVDHLAQSVGKVKPAALWASGVELSTLIDEDGNVDPVKVEQACASAIENLGLQRTPRPDPSIGLGFGSSSASTFADAFRRH